MTKSILLSIRPRYCELIASGKKKVELRKNEPKIKTPFKCYIYCTKGGSDAEKGNFPFAVELLGNLCVTLFSQLLLNISVRKKYRK